MSTYTLDIKDFQIIKNANLQFHTGLTLIQGLSNHGKSSIFKAFRQLLYNTSGTDYIRHNQPNTKITLKYNDVYIIEYFKSKTKSQYTIQNANGTEVYSKLGSSQLEQIKSLTNIDKELDYNFWYQMDKPFLISNSPKEQFDILQNSPHSAVLTSCLRSMTEDRKIYQKQEIQFQSQLELIQQQNKQFANDLQKLPQITQLFNQIDALKERSAELKDFSFRVAHLNQLTLEHQNLLKQVQNLQNLPELTPLINLNDQINQFTLKFRNLQQTIHPINDLKNQIQNTAVEYDKVKLFLDQHFPNCPLCNQPFHTHQ